MTLPKRTFLYRAALTVEEYPKPRKCIDTGKVGVYFSCYHPYLAETMCIEHRSDLFIAVYEVIEEIENLSQGKYGFTNGYTGRYSKPWKYVPPEDNLSHIDYDIYPTEPEVKDFDGLYAEVFLTEKDLPKIKFAYSYVMTLESSVRKWC